MSNQLRKTFKIQENILKVLKNEAWFMIVRTKDDMKPEMFEVVSNHKEECRLLYAYGRLDNMDKKNVSEAEFVEHEAMFAERCDAIDNSTPLGVFIRDHREVASTIYLLGATVSYMY